MSKRLRRSLLYGFSILIAVAFIGLYAYGGMYGINVVLRRGAYIWVPISNDDSRISNSMRLALHDAVPPATAGKPEWRMVANGFEVAELPVFANGLMVDQILLARIDPALYRFHIHNAPAGNRELDDWMKETGAVLVINGSYFARDGTPATPIMSLGRLSGPREYDGRHGAFVASDTSAAVIDLSQQNWRSAFADATDAMVSYPLLIAGDGTTHVKGDPRWLANRSFIAEDKAGRIVLGTTRDAFFSLERLAAFLQQAPLDLKLALNLDGGPVACQGISVADFQRDFCGQWEIAVHHGQLKLLQPLIGKRRSAMPIILAVSRK